MPQGTATAIWGEGGPSNHRAVARACNPVSLGILVYSSPPCPPSSPWPPTPSIGHSLSGNHSTSVSQPAASIRKHQHSAKHCTPPPIHPLNVNGRHTTSQTQHRDRTIGGETLLHFPPIPCQTSHKGPRRAVCGHEGAANRQHCTPESAGCTAQPTSSSATSSSPPPP